MKKYPTRSPSTLYSTTYVTKQSKTTNEFLNSTPVNMPVTVGQRQSLGMERYAKRNLLREDA